MAEAVAIVRGLQAKEKRDMEALRVTNYELARLISFSFNNPKDMPDYEPIGGGKKPDSAQNNEVATMRVSAYFRALAER